MIAERIGLLFDGVRRVEPFPQNLGPLRNRPASGRDVVYAGRYVEPGRIGISLQVDDAGNQRTRR